MSNIAIVNRWFEEVWNQGHQDVIDELISDPCEIIGLDENIIRSPGEMKDFHSKMNGALDNINITVDCHLESGDKVAAIFTVAAIHKVTRKNVCSKGSFVATVDQGRICHSLNVVDFLTMFVQAGVLPPDTMAKGLTTSSVC